MPLTSGTRIGTFEITGVLGAGGMGEELQSPVWSRRSSVRLTTVGLMTAA